MKVVGQTADGLKIYGPVVSSITDDFEFFVDEYTAWYLNTLVELAQQGVIDFTTAQQAETDMLFGSGWQTETPNDHRPPHYRHGLDAGLGRAA